MLSSNSESQVLYGGKGVMLDTSLKIQFGSFKWSILVTLLTFLEWLSDSGVADLRRGQSLSANRFAVAVSYCSVFSWVCRTSLRSALEPKTSLSMSPTDDDSYLNDDLRRRTRPQYLDPCHSQNKLERKKLQYVTCWAWLTVVEDCACRQHIGIELCVTLGWILHARIKRFSFHIYRPFCMTGSIVSSRYVEPIDTLFCLQSTQLQPSTTSELQRESWWAVITFILDSSNYSILQLMHIVSVRIQHDACKCTHSYPHMCCQSYQMLS